MNRIILTALVLGVALIWDLRTGRIPNLLTLTFAGSALAYRFWTMWRMPVTDLVLVTGFLGIVLGSLWRMNLLGAGDIKILTGLGWFWGFEKLMEVLGWSLGLSLPVFAVLSVVKGKRVRTIPYMVALNLGFYCWVIIHG